MTIGTRYSESRAQHQDRTRTFRCGTCDVIFAIVIGPQWDKRPPTADEGDWLYDCGWCPCCGNGELEEPS